MHAQALTLVPPSTASHASQGVATVSLATDEQLRVRFDGCELPAEQAASCLLSPALGDQVWVASDPEHGLFVLAILRRADPSTARIAVRGELELRATGPLRLTTPDTLALRSEAVEVDTQRATFTATELRAIASRVVASFARVTRIGELLELLVDTVTQRSQTSLRVVTGLDHSESGTVNQQVSGDLHINAQRALVSGGELVKLDGDQIHVG